MSAESWERRGSEAAAAALMAIRLGESPRLAPPDADEQELRWWRNGWNKRLAGG